MTRDEVLHMCDQYIEVIQGHIDACAPKVTQAVVEFVSQYMGDDHSVCSAWYALGFLQAACAMYGIYSIEELSLQTRAGSVI